MGAEAAEAARELSWGAAPVVEAMRCLDGWCALEARDPTLDGSLPLRVVQGCAPMLDGVGFGIQLRLELPLEISLGLLRDRVEELPFDARVERWGLAAAPARDGAALRRVQTQRDAVVPSLKALGWLPPEATLPLFALRRRGASRTLTLWTGYLVRVAPEVRLVTLRASPRRTLGVDSAPCRVDAHLGWRPLCVELSLERDIDRLVLEGELATLGTFAPGVPVEFCSLRDAPGLPRALLDFYDEAYFNAKRRGEVTRKYRRLRSPDGADGTSTLRVAEGGPSEVALSAASALGDVASLDVRCAMELTVRFDGQRVRLDAPEAALCARREAIEAAWRDFASPDDPTRRGALLYLTRYMTPHPFGEAHFFVKPCALFETAPGWSCLIEGRAHGALGDTLRGVVRTDVFHALPAVFALHAARAPATLAAGAVLARVLPLPHAWTSPSLATRAFEPARGAPTLPPIA